MDPLSWQLRQPYWITNSAGNQLSWNYNHSTANFLLCKCIWKLLTRNVGKLTSKVPWLLFWEILPVFNPSFEGRVARKPEPKMAVLTVAPCWVGACLESRLELSPALEVSPTWVPASVLDLCFKPALLTSASQSGIWLGRDGFRQSRHNRSRSLHFVGSVALCQLYEIHLNKFILIEKLFCCVLLYKDH